LSEVGFGLWTLSTEAWGTVNEHFATGLLTTAYDLGVNYFDTADSDGEGYGEQLLAKALGDERHNIVIGTKVGYDFYDRLAMMEFGGPRPHFDPSYLRHACEESLQRLGTDYIDLYQLHHPRAEVFESEEFFEALDDLVSEGKIRYYGVALGPELGYADEGEAAITERHVASLQVVYNVLDQQPARDLADAVTENATGFIARSPHASGLLDGSMNQRTRLKEEDGYSPDAIEKLQPRIDQLGELDFLTDNMDAPIGQLAIKFALARPEMASVLPNIRTLETLQEYAAAPETRDLKPHMLDRLVELHDEYFHPASSGDGD